MLGISKLIHLAKRIANRLANNILELPPNALLHLLQQNLLSFQPHSQQLGRLNTIPRSQLLNAQLIDTIHPRKSLVDEASCLLLFAHFEDLLEWHATLGFHLLDVEPALDELCCLMKQLLEAWEFLAVQFEAFEADVGGL